MEPEEELVGCSDGGRGVCWRGDGHTEAADWLRGRSKKEGKMTLFMCVFQICNVADDIIFWTLRTKKWRTESLFL